MSASLVGPVQSGKAPWYSNYTSQPEGPVSLKLRFLAKKNLINVLSHDALAGKQREGKKKEAGGEQTAKMRLTNLTLCV